VIGQSRHQPSAAGTSRLITDGRFRITSTVECWASLGSSIYPAIHKRTSLGQLPRLIAEPTRLSAVAGTPVIIQRASRAASSDLVELNYAEIAKAFGCLGIRIEDPGFLNAALREGLANTSSPTVIDCVVTRDPGRMLPAADNRTLKVQSGDRPV
jgi:hypothetical protein